MSISRKCDENSAKTEVYNNVLKSVKGFVVKQRDFNQKLYLQHICNKENRIVAEMLASKSRKNEIC